jgi:hypothetical protein
MFATSRDEALPREKVTRRAQKQMRTTFFNTGSLVPLNTLPSGAQFNQGHFLHKSCLRLSESEGDFFIDFAGTNFCAHGQFHGRKMTDELDNLKLDRVLDPHYSPALSLCNFWVFVMLEQIIKDEVFRCILAISQGMG